METVCRGKGCRRMAGMVFDGKPLCPKCGRKWVRRNRYALGLGPEVVYDKAKWS